MQCAKCYDTVAVMLTDQEKRIRAEYIGGPMSKPEMTDVMQRFKKIVGDWIEFDTADLYTRAMDNIEWISKQKAAKHDICGVAVVIIKQLLAQLQRQRERTGEAVPFAYVIPGDGNANDYGWIDCRVTREGEFTQPVYLAPPSPPSSRELMEKIKAVFKTHKDTAIAYGFTGDADMFSIIEDEVCALIPQEPKEEGNG
jgi:hypothetical protein